MDRLRRAAVAGSWYPKEPARLAAEVDRHLAATAVEPSVPPRAIIAPHAGLAFSGPVAAYAYKVAHAVGYEAVVLIGPSHFVPFRGVSIWPNGSWETPFGPVAVDRALAAELMTEWDEIAELPVAHGREHSIEMQLPFIARLLPGVPIVPIVMGHQTRETAFGLGDALGEVLVRRGGGSGVLVVASSDLSHYEEASIAAELDAVVIRHVERIDPEKLMIALEREPRHACGGGPMVSVLRAVRRCGAGACRILRYGDSGDVSGDKSAVVGYLAAAIW